MVLGELPGERGRVAARELDLLDEELHAAPPHLVSGRGAAGERDRAAPGERVSVASRDGDVAGDREAAGLYARDGAHRQDVGEPHDEIGPGRAAVDQRPREPIAGAGRGPVALLEHIERDVRVFLHRARQAFEPLAHLGRLKCADDGDPTGPAQCRVLGDERPLRGVVGGDEVPRCVGANVDVGDGGRAMLGGQGAVALRDMLDQDSGELRAGEVPGVRRLALDVALGRCEHQAVSGPFRLDAGAVGDLQGQAVVEPRDDEADRGVLAAREQARALIRCVSEFDDGGVDQIERLRAHLFGVVEGV